MESMHEEDVKILMAGLLLVIKCINNKIEYAVEAYDIFKICNSMDNQGGLSDERN